MKQKIQDQKKKRQHGDGTTREEISAVQTKEDGTYEIKVYEPGLYDIKLSKKGYLNTRIIEIEVGEKDDIVEVEEQALVAGDVAVDGEIEIDDLVDINDNYGVEVTEENKEEKSIFDLNEDGKIDLLDRVILKKNYGKIAEEIKWVKPNRRRRKMLEEDGTENETLEDENQDVLTSDLSHLNSQQDISVITDENGTVLLTRLEEKYLILPMTCEYKITSEYGKRIHPITGEEKLHAGIDLVGEHHTEILTIAEGTVTYAGEQNGYGNCIEIKHNVNGKTIYSFYAHLSKIEVKVGEKVEAGDIIGLEGGAKTDPNPGTSTGHHLHFEIRTASGSGHSIDPRKYIDF